ncbi:MAG: CHAD domain-containing protein [Deltaproteobacteria bacterium]|nr:MAG: CHAD domain-containing protein [Deltaproteobacteria bacterium]
MSGGRRHRGPARLRVLLLSPNDPAGEAVTSTLRLQLQVFGREEAGARAGEVEPVHQLRVATRRLRAGLRLFEPVLAAATVRRACDELAWLGDSIGAVRDLDVLLLAIASRGRRLDPVERDALAPLVTLLRERRAIARDGLVRALEGDRCRRLLTRLGSVGGVRRELVLGRVAGDLATPHLRAVLRAGRRLGGDASPAAFHRLRVRVKRLRYALETLRGLGGRRLVRMLRLLERFQDTLGAQQDAATQIARLRELADAASLPPATLLAMGALIRVLGRRARRRRRRFPELWRKLDRDALRQGALEELSRHKRAGRVLRLVRATGT